AWRKLVRPGTLGQPAFPARHAAPVGACGISQVSWRPILCLCPAPRPRPSRQSLAFSGLADTAPGLPKPKAPAGTQSRGYHRASASAVYASRATSPSPMQDSLPAGGLRLYREGVEPSGSLRKVSGYVSILLSRTSPVARVDMNELDAEFLRPQATRRALEPCIGAVGAFGIARPEDDHLGFLEAILDPAIARRHSNAHRIAEMVHGTPVPALPAIRVGRDSGEADQIGEAHERAEVIPHVSPLVVGRHGKGDGTGAVDALLPVDLLGNDIQRLVPANTHIARLAPVLGIALAVGIEIHPLHGVQDALVRIDQGFQRQRVWRNEAAARRAVFAAAGFDHPGRRIGVIELDGSDPYDAAVPDVNEHGTPVRAGRVAAATIGHRRSHGQAGGFARVESLREPDHQFVRPAR